MTTRERRELQLRTRAELIRSIIRADLGPPYRHGSLRPINFNHYADSDQAVDIATELEERRPGFTR